ncbi:MAG: hypothetical protein E7048_10785 [Lentisphaerae bacterium]|nr:hypothetical protein [Lentisphaerota bacterium]
MARKGKKSDAPKEKFPGAEKLDLKVRIFLLAGIMGLLCIIIIFRLYQEQILSSAERQQKITTQSVKRIRLPGRRGNIHTSDGVLLAGNTGTLQILFFPEQMRKRRRKETIAHMLASAETLAQAVGRKNILTWRKISRHLYLQPAMPLLVMDDLTPLEAARAMECANSIEGVELVGADVRSYPEGTFAAQLIGYTGSAPAASSADRKEFNLYVPDVVGKQGAEKAFDYPGDNQETIKGLLGEPGYALVRVNNVGNAVNRHIGRYEPRHGNNVFLTLDYRAQKLAQKLLGFRRGAFVVLDASNGAIIAAASSPTFDLKRFTPVIPEDYYAELLRDPGRPLLNRTTLGLYTPGSIMKVLTALAMLNKGHDPATRINCPGYALIGNAKLRCASRYGHGDLDLANAIKHSCNTYMIKGTAQLSVEEIAAVMKAAGLGSPTGIETEERGGLLPSREAKARRYKGYHARWTAFDTALISIGQGMVMVTPLQAANVAAAFANGGVWYKPHFLDRITDQLGRQLMKHTPREGGRLPGTPAAIATIQKAMFKVVNDSDGSGRRAQRPGLEIYGKTGSAESGPKDKRIVTTWFIAYVKYKNKTYASALVYEEGRSGGSDCAPLVGEFFERFLLKKSKNE